ncbi:MAG: prolipoprotein diacylglyceryl transferase [Clostridia bacterium]
MENTFSLLGLTGYYYGLCASIATLLLLGMMGGLGYAVRLKPGTVRIFGLLAIPMGIVCSRAVYCALNMELFLETYTDPWLMLRFFDGGLSMTGLLIGLVLAAFFTARLRKVRFGTMLDVLCVSLGLLIAVLRIAEGFTDLGVGKVVEPSGMTAAVPWLFLPQRAGVNIEYRLAVYRYEALAGLALTLVMLGLFIAACKRKRTRPGDLALVFFSLYGASQTILESMRDDGHLLITFLRVAQLAAAFMPLIAAGIFTRRYLHIAQKGGARAFVLWTVLAACIGGLVLLEFSLDGRITIGSPSLARDYGIMTVLCILLAAIPCSLYHTLTHKLYREDHMAVHVPQG